jgi:hypothetical protein
MTWNVIVKISDSKLCTVQYGRYSPLSLRGGYTVGGCGSVIQEQLRGRIIKQAHGGFNRAQPRKEKHRRRTDCLQSKPVRLMSWHSFLRAERSHHYSLEDATALNVRPVKPRIRHLSLPLTTVFLLP